MPGEAEVISCVAAAYLSLRLRRNSAYAAETLSAYIVQGASPDPQAPAGLRLVRARAPRQGRSPDQAPRHPSTAEAPSKRFHHRHAVGTVCHTGCIARLHRRTVVRSADGKGASHAQDVAVWPKSLHFVLSYKRLERGRFRAPRLTHDGRAIEMDATELAMLLDGIDVRRVRRAEHWQPPTPPPAPETV